MTRKYLYMFGTDQKYFHLMVEPFNMKIVDLESGLYLTTREMPVHSPLVFLFWWCIKSCLLLLRGVLERVEGGDPPACSSWAGPLKKCIPWWIWEHGDWRHWLRTHSNKYHGPCYAAVTTAPEPPLQIPAPDNLSLTVFSVRVSNFLYKQTTFPIIYR